jgi:hypothetical protein
VLHDPVDVSAGQDEQSDGIDGVRVGGAGVLRYPPRIVPGWDRYWWGRRVSDSVPARTRHHLGISRRFSFSIPRISEVFRLTVDET